MCPNNANQPDAFSAGYLLLLDLPLRTYYIYSITIIITNYLNRYYQYESPILVRNKEN